MPVNEEEDFELVLGNRQLFFLAVVLFGVFFSVGYTVGYGRGRSSADEVAAASRQPAPATNTASSLRSPEPEILREQPAEPEPTQATAPPQATSDTLATPKAGLPPTPSSASNPPLRAAANAARSASATPQAGSAAPPAPTAGSMTDKPTASAAPPAPRSKKPLAPVAVPSSENDPQAPKPTIAVPAIEPGAIYLQVLASRDADPTREALVEIRAKGHPVALDNSDPEWYRILVGPFRELEQAAQYQLRLKEQGLDSFIRKL